VEVIVTFCGEPTMHEGPNATVPEQRFDANDPPESSCVPLFGLTRALQARWQAFPFSASTKNLECVLLEG